MKYFKNRYSITDPSLKAFIPKKQLGQNFLVDQNIIHKIIAACQFEKADTVLEIGSGLGALTGHIASKVSNVIAIETDQRLCEELKKKYQGQNITVIKADFLKYNLNSLPLKIKAIGNLPFYISSAIIANILENQKHFSSLCLTVQYEFGQRLIAKVGTKDYSAFSCFVQYYSDPQMLFRIKNTSSKPAPKVESCFMKLSIREKPLYESKDTGFLFTIIRQAFQQRRKTITNSLTGLIGKKKLESALETLKINSQSRAENLDIKDYVALADSFQGQKLVTEDM